MPHKRGKRSAERAAIREARGLLRRKLSVAREELAAQEQERVEETEITEEERTEEPSEHYLLHGFDVDFGVDSEKEQGSDSEEEQDGAADATVTESSPAAAGCPSETGTADRPA
eukprot:2106070-Amphidinium_carterae.1